MQKLHLVGFTTDHEGLILSARRGARSGSYLVTIDASLEEAVDQLRARRAESSSDAGEPDGGTPRAARVESVLPVREIQARLRQGRSIAEVAKAAGVDAEWIERFAPPVLAERAQVIAKVRAVPLRRARLGASVLPIGEAIRHHLADRGVAQTADEFADAWTARQIAEGRWAVRFTFRYRGRDQVLRFDLDESTGEVSTADRASGQLGYVAPPATAAPTPARPRPAAPKPVRSPEPRPTAKRAVVSTGFRAQSAAKATSRSAREREKATVAMDRAAARRAVEGERAAARKAKERRDALARQAREEKAAASQAAREARAAEQAAAAKAKAKAADKAKADKAKAKADNAKAVAKSKAAADKARAQTARAAATKTGKAIAARKAAKTKAAKATSAAKAAKTAPATPAKAPTARPAKALSTTATKRTTATTKATKRPTEIKATSTKAAKTPTTRAKATTTGATAKRARVTRVGAAEQVAATSGTGTATVATVTTAAAAPVTVQASTAQAPRVVSEPAKVGTASRPAMPTGSDGRAEASRPSAVPVVRVAGIEAGRAAEAARAGAGAGAGGGGATRSARRGETAARFDPEPRAAVRDDAPADGPGFIGAAANVYGTESARAIFRRGLVEKVSEGASAVAPVDGAGANGAASPALRPRPDRPRRTRPLRAT